MQNREDIQPFKKIVIEKPAFVLPVSNSQVIHGHLQFAGLFNCFLVLFMIFFGNPFCNPVILPFPFGDSKPISVVCVIAY